MNDDGRGRSALSFLDNRLFVKPPDEVGSNLKKYMGRHLSFCDDNGKWELERDDLSDEEARERAYDLSTAIRNELYRIGSAVVITEEIREGVENIIRRYLYQVNRACSRNVADSRLAVRGIEAEFKRITLNHCENPHVVTTAQSLMTGLRSRGIWVTDSDLIPYGAQSFNRHTVHEKIVICPDTHSWGGAYYALLQGFAPHFNSRRDSRETILASPFFLEF